VYTHAPERYKILLLSVSLTRSADQTAAIQVGAFREICVQTSPFAVHSQKISLPIITSPVSALYTLLSSLEEV
jgi:hypothetical protein